MWSTYIKYVLFNFLKARTPFARKYKNKFSNIMHDKVFSFYFSDTKKLS